MPGGLPTFLIVGAAKAGTTSLWAALATHPDVFMSPTKEPHFFDDDANWSRGPDWYRRFFASGEAETAVGEATPTYMSAPPAPARMASTVPDARLVAVLRDPVQRAYSQYFHMRYYGWEARSFEEAVAEELRTPNWDLPPHYLAMGCYATQLERLAAHYPKERILAFPLEDLRSDPKATFEAVLSHLGVDPTKGTPGGRAENTYREVRLEPLARRLRASQVSERASPRVRQLLVRMFTRTGAAPPPMDPSTRRTLYAAFGEQNERLASWLDRDLSAWSDG